MTAADQIQMFEPQGSKLAELVAHHLAVYAADLRAADNLHLSGFVSSALARSQKALAAQATAMQCELALQFESLAGLS